MRTKLNICIFFFFFNYKQTWRSNCGVKTDVPDPDNISMRPLWSMIVVTSCFSCSRRYTNHHQITCCLVSDCCLTPNDQFLQLFHGEEKLHLMRWWWWYPRCSIQTLKMLLYSERTVRDRHYVPWGHISMISSQPIFPLTS